MKTAWRNQQGFTLLIGMMMLMVITLMVLSSIRTGMTNSRIVGNMQFRDEATSAAQVAIEQTMGATTFVSNPQAVADNPVQVDINGDGVNDYSVTMTPKPACLAYKVLKIGELTMPQDLQCTEGVGAGGSGASTFIPGGFAQKTSLCATTHWKISSNAENTFNGAKVSVVQGVSVRVDTLFAETFCGS